MLSRHQRTRSDGVSSSREFRLDHDSPIPDNKQPCHLKFSPARRDWHLTESRTFSPEISASLHTDNISRGQYVRELKTALFAPAYSAEALYKPT